MTTCRTCVKNEAPNIATKPSMATSNAVSSLPTIQSIIRRIGTPVMLTVKFDRLSSRRPAFFDRLCSRQLYWLHEGLSRNRRQHQFSRALQHDPTSPPTIAPFIARSFVTTIGERPARHLSSYARKSRTTPGTGHSLEYSNAGSILSPSFDPPGNTIFLSANFRLS